MFFFFVLLCFFFFFFFSFFFFCFFFFVFFFWSGGRVFSETVGSFEIKVHLKAYGNTGSKIYTNQLGQVIQMATMPMYSKNLKNLCLQYQWTDGLETWYVASGTRVLP